MEEYICKFCKKTCKNANSLRNHERLCKLNLNRDFKSLNALTENRNKWNASYHVAWNKGLTKNDKRVAKYTNTRKLNLVNGLIDKSKFSHLHTKETKDKISKKQKENYKNISRYATAREGRKSYAEQYFDTIFIEAKHNYHIDRYFLDYAWPDKKIYVEVDGEQHYTENRFIA